MLQACFETLYVAKNVAEKRCKTLQILVECSNTYSSTQHTMITEMITGLNKSKLRGVEATTRSSGLTVETNML